MSTIFSNTMHRTTEGVELPIAEMTDSHLLNVLKLVGSKIGRLKYELEHPVTEMSNIQRAMLLAQGRALPEPANVDNTALSLGSGITKAQPYVLEGLLRPGIQAEVIALWQEMIGRTEKLPDTMRAANGRRMIVEALMVGRGRPGGDWDFAVDISDAPGHYRPEDDDSDAARS